MFTGLGAVIVAITGLITALYSAGVIGSKASSSSNAAPSANTSVALASSPAPTPNDPESERFKSLAGKWEVIETPSLDFDDVKRVTKRYEATVSGNVLTLTGKILAVGVDKNLSEEEEGITSTLITTLVGSGGIGEYKVKAMDGTTLVYEATIRLADDLKQFQGKVDTGGVTYKFTGRKL